MGKELIDSRRIRVINYQTSDIHADVSALNEALVDREATEALSLIDSVRSRLNILKDQIVNGDLVRNNN